MIMPDPEVGRSHSAAKSVCFLIAALVLTVGPQTPAGEGRFPGVVEGFSDRVGSFFGGLLLGPGPFIDNSSQQSGYSDLKDR